MFVCLQLMVTNVWSDAWSNVFHSCCGLTNVSSSVLKMNLEVWHSLERTHWGNFSKKQYNMSVLLCQLNSQIWNDLKSVLDGWHYNSVYLLYIQWMPFCAKLLASVVLSGEINNSLRFLNIFYFQLSANFSWSRNHRGSLEGAFTI